MSVTSATYYTLHCDHVPECRRRYNTTHPVPPSEVRRLAADDGWKHARNLSAAKLDKDYCPEHAP